MGLDHTEVRSWRGWHHHSLCVDRRLVPAPRRREGRACTGRARYEGPEHTLPPQAVTAIRWSSGGTGRPPASHRMTAEACSEMTISNRAPGARRSLFRRMPARPPAPSGGFPAVSGGHAVALRQRRRPDSRSPLWDDKRFKPAVAAAPGVPSRRAGVLVLGRARRRTGRSRHGPRRGTPAITAVSRPVGSAARSGFRRRPRPHRARPEQSTSRRRAEPARRRTRRRPRRRTGAPSPARPSRRTR